MIREISVEEIDNLDSLTSIYLAHKKEDFVTLETVKKQMHSGIEKGNVQVLCDYDSDLPIQAVAAFCLTRKIQTTQLSQLG